MAGICEFGPSQLRPTSYVTPTGYCTPCEDSTVAWISLGVIVAVLTLTGFACSNKLGVPRRLLRRCGTAAWKRANCCPERRALHHQHPQLEGQEKRSMSQRLKTKFKLILGFYQAWSPKPLLFLHAEPAAARVCLAWLVASSSPVPDSLSLVLLPRPFCFGYSHTHRS